MLYISHVAAGPNFFMLDNIFAFYITVPAVTVPAKKITGKQHIRMLYKACTDFMEKTSGSIRVPLIEITLPLTNLALKLASFYNIDAGV